MPVAGYSVGRDIKLVFVDENSGSVVTWPVLASADFRPDFRTLKWVQLDGTHLTAELPAGWTGTFTVERGGPDLMDYAVQAENDYYLGRPSASVYLQQTVTNPDGSVSQYRFTKGAVKLTDAGKWTGDEKVTQTVSVAFSRCLKVS
ncbi:conserved protein of unknown function [Rhodovastum atsumiense]|uniref:Uncharacterized protein n=1 Tax=Rhodovastum atsumiense TaxID=504468 RepID=A0A5M6IYV8_9PROT|nr:hypothetical protein [Rhodovastum atsumiense]KAA5613471.1 hypothetical protein F1189_05290 [Rhodovastum atsumiense]CAH2603210.1 conserved protein of unknown function [Rhodovastum atsumiense]